MLSVRLIVVAFLIFFILFVVVFVLLRLRPWSGCRRGALRAGRFLLRRCRYGIFACFFKALGTVFRRLRGKMQILYGGGDALFAL